MPHNAKDTTLALHLLVINWQLSVGHILLNFSNYCRNTRQNQTSTANRNRKKYRIRYYPHLRQLCRVFVPSLALDKVDRRAPGKHYSRSLSKLLIYFRIPFRIMCLSKDFCRKFLSFRKVRAIVVKKKCFFIIVSETSDGSSSLPPRLVQNITKFHWLC